MGLLPFHILESIMSLYALKAFYIWLDEATSEELEARLGRLNAYITSFNNVKSATHLGPDSVKTAKYYRSKIEEEILLRIMK